MKYIKKFENDKNATVGNSYIHYGHEYDLKWDINKLKREREILDNNNIPYDIYYYEENARKIEYIKIYGYELITYKTLSIIEKMNFWTYDDYKFSWNWKKITDEELKFMIDLKKFNL